jgi:thioredoxin reductase/ferredoxin
MNLLQTLAKPIQDYAHWLHLRWPAGTPDPLPEVGPGGTTVIDGVRIAGDLLGIPLLKFAADSGAKAVQAFIAEGAFDNQQASHGLIDLAIVGGGVAGLSAALEAKKAGLNFRIYESSEPFSTVANFTNRKPIYTYPLDLRPAGEVQFKAMVKETLLDDLREQAERANIGYTLQRVERVVRGGGHPVVHFTEGYPPQRARRVLICVGKAGDHKQLGVPGEELEKVHNRLFDPNDYAGKKVLVVGGGDSALETAIALQDAGAETTLSYRGDAFSRPKPQNVGMAQMMLGDENILLRSQVTRIEPDKVILSTPDFEDLELENDDVFVMIGGMTPMSFFQASGIPVLPLAGMRANPRNFASLGLALLAVLLVYLWKTDGTALNEAFLRHGWFPFDLDWSEWAETSLFARLLESQVGKPGFYYELAYSLVVLVFGVRRIARYRTPYVTRQTLSLILVQTIPLFLLPYLILPLLGEWGAFDGGLGGWLGDQLFPREGGDGSREYWRSVGFILAWPLFIWNVFTPAPNGLWLAIAFLQTFVLIPWLVHRYGKGAYCGWICSCGALAETLGDAHRRKMPHGPFWNQLNFAGQAILAAVLGLLLLRLLGWVLGEDSGVNSVFDGLAFGYAPFGVPLNYSRVVDWFLSGILGIGLYFHFSGRTWCRFFCPLAALMNIYGRFSRFRIFADKGKCISCSQCTSVCHQGIDVMNFANRGLPMEDPQCVRCSACVYHCPTGVLSFGRLGKYGEPVLEQLPASPVQMNDFRHLLRRRQSANAQGRAPR